MPLEPASSSDPGSTGGELGSGSAGGGGLGAADRPGAVLVARAECSDAEVLPQGIRADTRVGPGCVRVRQTDILDNATLTIEPGTTVLMESGGFLRAYSPLVAVGTVEAPIVFTSASADPVAGDWECIQFSSNSAASQLEHVVFEYGGAPCGATGAGRAATLDVDVPLRGLSNVSVTDSAGVGIRLSYRAPIRAFSDNRFARNEGPSLQVSGEIVSYLGTGNVFEDADDFIDVPGGLVLESEQRWRNQGVPLRVASLGLSPGAGVTIEAGVRIEMRGGSLDAFDANLDIEGTADAPVVFTSAQPNPQPGDWGCLLYSYSNVTPRIDHAIFEYAGSGQGCLGASTRTALYLPAAASITNTTFRYIAGTAIHTRGMCPVEAWCANEFVELEGAALSCNDGDLYSCE